MSEETAIVVTDSETDLEALPEEFRGYAGVATIQLSDAQKKVFDEILADDAHDVLPTGEVYVPQVHYRRRLNLVFGPGGWAMVPRGPYDQQGKTLCREYALVAQGRFVSEATGEADYHESNERMSYASAAEAVKSNAIMRCCKDLGIGWECWDARFCERFKKDHCVKVWRENTSKPQWRRKDAEPWWNEKGKGATAGDFRVPQKRAKARGVAKAKDAAEAVRNAEPPSEATTCCFCDSADVDVAEDGTTATCGDCHKGWNLGR